MNQTISQKINDHFAHSPKQTYLKGEILTQAGDDPAGVSLLRSGIVEQYDITPEGNRVTVNIFKPSAFFPMSWAINKTPNTYFYAALTDVVIQRTNAESTVAFLQAHPDVTFDLLSRVYKGTDALLRRIVITATGIAANRLIFELLIEAYRFGTSQPNGTVKIAIKQQALAERSGLARETVNRELHKLVERGLIVMNKPGITIAIDKLEELLNVAV